MTPQVRNARSPRHVTLDGRNIYHLAAGLATLLTLGLRLCHRPAYGLFRARDRVFLAAADPEILSKPVDGGVSGDLRFG